MFSMNCRSFNIVTIFSMAMMLSTCQSISNSLHPVILVPGSGGNQLEARLTSEYKPTSPICNRWYPIKKDKEGWFRIWFDSSVVLAPFTSCLADRMTLYYDSELGDYGNAPGIETRVLRFGSTESLLYLDPNLKHITNYMASLVKSLQEIGYVDSENLFGAPYDFRYGLAAKGHRAQVGSKYLSDLKNLIETASDSNDGKPVIVLSHSLGGLFALQLLNQTTSAWRTKYIKHFLALSAPWGGSVQEMLTLASGYSLGVPFVDPLRVRNEQRSFESNLWLLPSPQVFDTQNPLVITQNARYTVDDIEKFLFDIGFGEDVSRYTSRILPLVSEKFAGPDVPVTCVIGVGVKTPETLFYKGTGDYFDEQPEIVYGDGDGTVNLVSLLGLESLWDDGEKNHEVVKIVRVSGVSHTSILEDNVALSEIMREILDINSNVSSKRSNVFML